MNLRCLEPQIVYFANNHPLERGPSRPNKVKHMDDATVNGLSQRSSGNSRTLRHRFGVGKWKNISTIWDSDPLR